MDDLYRNIFKRKSFHFFKNTDLTNIALSENDLVMIINKYHEFTPLIDNIETTIRIVGNDEVKNNRGQEKWILFYSEKKDNYLANIGYLGEQLDLYLANENIGALWFGIGKVKPTEMKIHVNGKELDFVIMLAIAKTNEESFRKNMFKSKRKELSEIWISNKTNDYLDETRNIVRYAPSACNSQPWIVIEDDKKLSVYRYKKPGKRGIMPIEKITYYNQIDIGIFLLFLDLCLNETKYKNITKKIYRDINDLSNINLFDEQKILICEYELK